MRAYEPVPPAPYFEPKPQRLPANVLCFDTETTTDTTQTLRVGAFAIWQRGVCTERATFWPNDVDARTYPRDSSRHMSLAQFQARLEHFSHARDSVVIGFNLPFDIARVSTHVGRARGRFAGGFSFAVGEYGRVRTKHIGPAKTLMSWGQTRYPARGRLMDVATLASALLGRRHSLASLCDALGVENKKLSAEHGRAITGEYLAYLRRDVLSTWECYEKLAALWQSYGLEYSHISSIYSEASVGKAALKQIGIKPFWALNPDFPDWLMGAAMQTFYGGRSEVTWRRECERVVYVDFLSMYPTVCVLMGLWRFVTAERIDFADDTENVKRLLSRKNLPLLSASGAGRSLWRNLACIVQVTLHDDILPARCIYPGQSDASIGLNHIRTDEPIWYTLADCIASARLTGKAPHVLRAVRFIPTGRQKGLRKLAILGSKAHEIAPYRDDFYRRLIELRATTTGDERQAIKLIANSTCYGIYAELNIDASVRKSRAYTTGDKELTGNARAMEKPGSFHNPILATLVTGAARLMLATLERQVSDAGLSHVLCDTDSMAVRVTSRDDVGRVRGIVDSYAALNPYGPPITNVLKIEHGGDVDAPVYAYAVSAKRYALFSVDGRRGDCGDSRQRPRVTIVKASAHGLGHLRAPDGRNAVTPVGVADWLAAVWQELVEVDGFERVDVCLDSPLYRQPAMSQFTVSGPSLLRYGMSAYHFASIFHPSRTYPMPGCDVAIAPFDAAPHTAARHAVAYPAGRPIAASGLMTYADMLSGYHEHAEGKFDGGDARGQSRRRIVVACGYVYIGKESGELAHDIAGFIDVQSETPYGGGKRVKAWYRGTQNARRPIEIADPRPCKAYAIERVRAGVSIGALADAIGCTVGMAIKVTETDYMPGVKLCAGIRKAKREGLL